MFGTVSSGLTPTFAGKLYDRWGARAVGIKVAPDRPGRLPPM
ncbi:MAG: hypothetical protein ACLFV7_00370 [Phycisphaerae bacterium]